MDNVKLYTMDVEKPAGTIRQHGFHLGTIRETAEKIVLERLSADPAVCSIALRFGGKVDKIYDFRNVE